MYWTCMVLMVCNSRITAISLAFMRALPSLGTAMARIIKMIAITIRSSISEKPRARRRFAKLHHDNNYDAKPGRGVQGVCSIKVAA